MAPFVHLTIAASIFAQPAHGRPNESPRPEFDSTMQALTRIDWDDPLNPRHVNLGDDQFLFDTRQGVKLWDFHSNTLTEPSFAPSIGTARIKQIERVLAEWARLGGSPAGTALLGRTKDDAPPALFWWDSQKREFSAVLPIPREMGIYRLQSLAPNHLLLCGETSAVVRLGRFSGGARLEWTTGADIEALQALQRAGVTGAVRGFDNIPPPPDTLPIRFDTETCGWEMVDAPSRLKPHVDKSSRKQPARIKPYFLADGRILIGEGSYHDGKYWNDLNPPLLWNSKARSWTEIEPSLGSGGRSNRLGTEEPVIVHSFESDVIQFLDTKAMRWVRSVERLPDAPDVDIEPLSTGGALAIMRESGHAARGVIGQVTPLAAVGASGGGAQGNPDQPPRVQAALPQGKLLMTRGSYDGELLLRNGHVMLLGGGDRWHPDPQVEVIDVATGQAHQIAPLPERLVAPVGLELGDGSIIVFGGFPARCGRDSHLFRNDSCSQQRRQSSYRYFAKEDRWQALPGLRIPFSRGTWWQTGNSSLATQWPRNDATVRKSGALVWIEDASETRPDTDSGLPQFSKLMFWTPAQPDEEGRMLNTLLKARTEATLVELGDGRLSVIGGEGQRLSVALDKDCSDCRDEFVSLGPFEAERSTEVLDESDPVRPAWKAGPTARYGGGRALKLANGRIFKLSLTGGFDSDGYRAEIADAAFTYWEELPPFPRTKTLIENVSVIGNRVVILMEGNQTVVWDDDQGRWMVWPQWASRGGKNPVSIVAAPDPHNALIRYPNSFVVAPMPTLDANGHLVETAPPPTAAPAQSTPAGFSISEWLLDNAVVRLVLEYRWMLLAAAGPFLLYWLLKELGRVMQQISLQSRVPGSIIWLTRVALYGLMAFLIFHFLSERLVDAY